MDCANSPWKSLSSPHKLQNKDHAPFAIKAKKTPVITHGEVPEVDESPDVAEVVRVVDPKKIGFKSKMSLFVKKNEIQSDIDSD